MTVRTPEQTRTEAGEALSSLAARPVVVTVDLHRGHLDPEVATLPLPAERCEPYVQHCVELLHGFRELGLPVIHVITSYRSRAEIVNNPYWRFVARHPENARARIVDHNLEKGPGLSLMPGIAAPGDEIVSTKKRYDCLVGTDLEFMLRAHDYNSVLLMGVNTNSCLLATSIALSVRDWATFMIEDGVDSMMGPEYHEAALKVFDGSFGWVVGGAAAISVLKDSAHAGSSTQAAPAT